MVIKNYRSESSFVFIIFSFKNSMGFKDFLRISKNFFYSKKRIFQIFFADFRDFRLLKILEFFEKLF